MTRTPPTIGTPPVSTKWDKPITDGEAKLYLKKKKIPVSTLNLKRAKTSIRSARKREWLKSLPYGRDVSYSQTDAPWRVVYGQMRIGGIITFAHETDNKAQMHRVDTYACHEVEKIEKLFLNNEEVTFASGSFGNATGKWANKVYLYAQNKGTVGQTAISQLITNVTTTYWTSNHKQSNRAHAYLKMLFDRELFGEGDPDVEFLIQGKKTYDPRTSTTYYNTNPALAIADYLTDTVYGCKIASNKIDWDSVSDSANICDQGVLLKSGLYETRYTLNGVFEADESHESVLRDMMLSMAGNIVYSNGKYKILAGAWRTPVATLNEINLRSKVSISTMISRQDIFNAVKGVFVDPANSYETSEFNVVANSSYATLDGQQIIEDITLNFTKSSSMAQRIAKIQLEDIRRQIKVMASFDLTAFKLDIGDNIYLNLPEFGFSNKTFEVVDWELEIDSSSGLLTQLSLKETDANIWDWNPASDENAITTAPTTNLPNPANVVAPVNLVAQSGTNFLYKKKDGSIFSRVQLTWDTILDAYVTQGGTVEIEYKKHADANYLPIVKLDGAITQFLILDVEDGVNYDFRIRACNAIGSTSAWLVVNHTVAGKTLPPANVTGIVGTFEDYLNKISWNPVADIDLKEYELRRGGSDWATATVVANLRHTNYADSYLTAGTIDYRVKAIDTSGNYSTLSNDVSITIDPPNVVENLDVSANDNQVLIDWEEPIASSLPILKYRVYRTSVSPINLIGEWAGTFASFFESVGGTYTYLVTAVDNGNNEGASVSGSTVVFKPTNFVLHDNQALNLATGTFDNCMMSDITANRILALINTSETWQDHFINNGWSTPQDQINAGFPIFAQPIPSSGSWTQEVDYGVELPNSLINLIYSVSNISGDLLITGNIYTKKLIGDPWVLNSGLSVFTSESFRYVKYELIFTKTSEVDFSEIFDVTAVVEVKVETDQGNSESLASGFLTVPINLDFITMKSIVPTPATLTGERLTPVLQYDWSTPDVDSFGIKFIDHNGTQVARKFSWIARGIIRPPA